MDNCMDGWINERDEEVGEREEETSLWKGGMWKFPQEERILCINYSQVIKIHAAHLPEMAVKKKMLNIWLCV